MTKFNALFAATLLVALPACTSTDRGWDSTEADCGEADSDVPLLDDQEALDDEEAVDDDEGPELAEADFDSFDSPLFSVSFLGSGAPGSFTLEDAISQPGGDASDWVEFTTPAYQNDQTDITFDLICDGTQGATAQVYSLEYGLEPLLGARVRCGEVDDIYLDTKTDYLVRVHYDSSEDEEFDAWSLEISR